MKTVAMTNRSLYGGDYVHINISDQFSFVGSWSVAILYLLALFSVRFLQRKKKEYAAIASLMGAMIMIIWRRGLVLFGEGPRFDVSRGIVVEPLLLMTGNLVVVAHIQKHGDSWIKDILSSGSRPLYQSLITMLLAFVITFVLGDYSALMLVTHVSETSTPGQHHLSKNLALLAGTTLGATLSITGNLSNFLIATVAYDDFSFLEFFGNKWLPTAAALAIYVLAFWFKEQSFPDSISTGKSILSILVYLDRKKTVNYMNLGAWQTTMTTVLKHVLALATALKPLQTVYNRMMAATRLQKIKDKLMTVMRDLKSQEP